MVISTWLGDHQERPSASLCYVDYMTRYKCNYITLHSWSSYSTSSAATFQLKAAYVTPLLKNSVLNPDDVKSYRPISNLSNFVEVVTASRSSTAYCVFVQAASCSSICVDPAPNNPWRRRRRKSVSAPPNFISAAGGCGSVTWAYPC